MSRNKKIPENIKNKITTIWNDYIKSDKTVLNTKGQPINQIDTERLKAIVDIKKIIQDFLNGHINLYEFKTDLDSYNKRNNLWGFTAAKGQMFFNLLTKSSESNPGKLSDLVKTCISEPTDLLQAGDKIDSLEKFASQIFNNAPDKRKAPNPASSGYFLSYFWQIHNYEKWPIIYTSLINAFKDLDLWENHNTQNESYQFFYKLNEDIKVILQNCTKNVVNNWSAEHAFWNYTGNPHVAMKKEKQAIQAPAMTFTENKELVTLVANFDKNEYLIPKVARLVELGQDSDKSGSAKGSEYEKMVLEIFKQLDFEVCILGQGKGRNPDAVIKYREDHTAFIVDAKAYSNGYNLGLDDRAIKEYINYHCPLLKKEGFTKIGFIIISNSFKSNLDSFINEITWNTDIKRFILLTSEALLYLLAYKTKDKLSVNNVIDCLISLGNKIQAEEIIGELEDV
ncbi:MAG: hypothetical protein JO154_23435 [Chitinophaga sp.]|uniref:restriction endonuclease FokI C-terminal domain-containing protein n=1 Tax=Chitinophaga sp. TaxID=1869181 RepID=UPI0025C389EF|nr:restriction endonuclease FokI C-terminal domain-containing protein [Chitinophaga sp.]MBV8255567.1 hypothetical protein [Chitinophaga sp.]